ncbi:MAG: transketolase family protein [Candidatus Pacebacteria bacterium]|nr:transketolase family protein [Candidatus Paceibacterota bacterium]
MINTELQLHSDIFNTDILDQAATRDGFGKGLVEAADADKNVVALCADLAESTRAHWFKEKYPDRYIELGVAEQNLAAVASGLANYGKIPFMMSYAAFSPGRNWEQIRSTIALNDVPAKIVGAHAGVSVGPDGATHQALEDIATIRVIPNMTVVVPADSEEACKATLAIAKNNKPSYIRLARAKTPIFTTSDTPFEIGVPQVVYESETPKVGIIACGSLVYQSILAAEALKQEGIEVSVMNLSTIKPMNEKAVTEFAQKVDRIVSAEEHQIHGGMGSAVAEVLAQHAPTKMSFIGMHDRFGESGSPDELLQEFGFTKEGIIEHIKSQLS